MDFKSRIMNVQGVENATVTLESGDRLSVGYKDTDGRFHTITIVAQHLVLVATHEQTESTMLIRPSTGCQLIPGIK